MFSSTEISDPVAAFRPALFSPPHLLVFGVQAAQRVLPDGILRGAIAGGLLLYALVGVVDLMLGVNYLDYSPMLTNPKDGQHLGIFLVELGVGITVASVMMTMFFTFATWREE